MTTLVVVRKKGLIAIAGDTLTTYGNTLETARYIRNHDKLLRVADSIVAITGSPTFSLIVKDYFGRRPAEAKFGSVDSIFLAWNRLHKALKEDYHILPEEHEDDALESSRFDALIANSHGIFGVSAERTVQEFIKYYAYGGGASYAIGAMYACYERPELDAQGIARLAIEAAAEFDDGTALPATCVCIPDAAHQDGG